MGWEQQSMAVLWLVALQHSSVAAGIERVQDAA